MNFWDEFKSQVASIADKERNWQQESEAHYWDTGIKGARNRFHKIFDVYPDDTRVGDNGYRRIVVVTKDSKQFYWLGRVASPLGGGLSVECFIYKGQYFWDFRSFVLAERGISVRE